MEALKGKKTYFTAGAAVLTALGAYFAGEVDLSVTIQACFWSVDGGIFTSRRYFRS